MADVSSISPIELTMVRAALGRDSRSDGRVDILIALAMHGPVNQVFLADRRGIEASSVKEQIEGLEKDGLAGIIERPGKRPLYRATPAGARIGLAIESLRAGQLGVELVGRVLVGATRAQGRGDRSLREAMLERASTVLTGYGSLQYVGICENDPELVEALQGRIEKLRGEPSVLRVEEIVSS